MKEAIEVVEQSFKEKGEGKVQMPPKMYINFDEFGGDFRVMPAYLMSSHAAGVKIVNVHPKNPREYGLPTVMATVILLEPETGFPMCVLDGTWLTAVRTGAAGGVAAKYLSRDSSTCIGMIGAGVQARAQLEALAEVRRIEAVRVYDISLEASRRFENLMREKVGAEILLAGSAEEATRGVDIIVTTTPSEKPVLLNEHVSQGMHINAIGADAPGKQELDTDILRRAKVVVDDIEQASHSGEVQTCLREGILTVDDLYGELGEIVAGIKKGRQSDMEITVFDSTGLAIQDVGTAQAVYRNALRRDVGTSIRMV